MDQIADEVKTDFRGKINCFSKVKDSENLIN